jgi:hypothetical protein
MTPKPLQTPAARAGAIGFILLIVVGNLWFVKSLTGEPIPEWMRLVGTVGVVLAFFGGGAVFFGIVGRWWKSSRASGDDGDDGDEPGQDGQAR